MSVGCLQNSVQAAVLNSLCNAPTIDVLNKFTDQPADYIDEKDRK